MTAREAIRSLIDKGITDKKELIDKVREISGVTYNRANHIYNAEFVKGNNNGLRPTLASQCQNQNIKTISAQDLIDQQRLDPAKIIRTALKTMAKGRCAYDESFRRDLGISQDSWKEIRELDEFLDFQIVLPNKKRVWCHPETRDELLRHTGVRAVT